ncbi:MAG: UDP-3-O-(3-hydroxymyristoyl)glucosamine N-acyltransferase [Candidatus Makaraimicrobium thalassicum]|nr:MAG: UDP-3-O-(3-hydroxymyristoyl)glucosamine N-acyltransferase [Candidatus Omnitrophota bacterium]
MITVNEIAKLVDGTVGGDGGIHIKGMASSRFAEEGDITFALDGEELERAGKSRASCVLTMVDMENYPKTTLRVGDMKLAITMLYNAMLEMKPPGKGVIHPAAVIAKSAGLGRDVSIGPNAVIGEAARIGDNTTVSANCVIGKNVTIGQRSCLYPNVTVYDCSVIGDRVIIHSGSVIGADGFGYVPREGKIYKVPQMGNVVIEDDVEIGANSCVDRGTFTSTVIGRGVKLDNQVQIAHNVKLGRNVIIAGQSAVAGSSTVGDNTMLGGQVGITDHVSIGSNVKAGAKTGITGNVKDDKVIFGYPAREVADARKLFALLSLLLKNARKFRALLRNSPDD